MDSFAIHLRIIGGGGGHYKLCIELYTYIVEILFVFINIISKYLAFLQITNATYT